MTKEDVVAAVFVAALSVALVGGLERMLAPRVGSPQATITAPSEPLP